MTQVQTLEGEGLLHPAREHRFKVWLKTVLEKENEVSHARVRLEEGNKNLRVKQPLEGNQDFES